MKKLIIFLALGIFLFSLASVSGYINQSININTPTIYYKFNQTSGNLTDESGNADLNITINDVIYGTGKIGNGGIDNSTNGGGWFPYSRDYNGNFTLGSENFTIAFWLNKSGLNPSSFIYFGGENPGGWAISQTSGNEVRFRENGLDVMACSGTIFNGLWHRIVFVRAGSLLTCYVDTVNNTAVTFTTNMNQTYGAFSILSTNNDGGKWYIDDFRIYRGYAWNSSDLSYDYNSGTGREITVDLGTSPISSNITNVSLTYPTNYLYTRNTSIDFTGLANFTNNISNYSLQVWASNGTLLENFSDISALNTNQTLLDRILDLGYDIFTWNFKVVSNIGEIAYSSMNYTLGIFQQKNITSENLNFNVANQSIIRYYNVYRYGNVTSAYLNLSTDFLNINFSYGQLHTGCPSGSYCTEQPASPSISCYNYTSQNYSATISYSNVYENSVENFSLPRECVSSNKTVSIVIYGYNSEFGCPVGLTCFGWGVQPASGFSFFPDIALSSVYYYLNLTSMENFTDNNYSTSVQFPDDMMIFINGTLNNNLTNPYLEVGTQNQTKVWNYSGVFNSTNQTSDFRSKLQAIMDNGCVAPESTLNGTVCQIPLLFHSDNIGFLNVVPQISWEEYVNPNLTVNEPNQTYNGITYVPINFTAVDDWQIDSCWFNVTRGLAQALEVPTTIIPGCLNTTTTVSGSATYDFNICVNDTSNNVNCTSTTFTTTNYVPPPASSSSSGGGGGGIFTDLTTPIKESDTCAPYGPALTTAWQNAVDNSFSVNSVWEVVSAFFNLGVCKSQSSILPI